MLLTKEECRLFDLLIANDFQPSVHQDGLSVGIRPKVQDRYSGRTTMEALQRAVDASGIKPELEVQS